MLDLFEKKLEDVTHGQNSYETPKSLYAPKLKDAPKGIYTARLRFLPNMINTDKTFNRLTMFKFKDAFGNNLLYVPSKSNFGEKCPINELSWKLKKSANPVEQALAKNVYYYVSYYSYVQILDDKVHPELNGQIMVFRYGQQIYKIIEEEINDNGGSIGCIINPETASDFLLKIQESGDYNTYTSSKFVPSDSCLKIGGKEVKANEAGVALIKKAEEALEISVDVENKPWSPETEASIMENLATYKAGTPKRTVVTPPPTIPGTVVESVANFGEEGMDANETGGYEDAQNGDVNELFGDFDF